MEDWEPLFRRKPIQELRGALVTLRQAGATRLKRVRRWRRWFVRGAIVGAAWAVLYAPQSGAETRQALGRFIRPLAEIGASLLTWLRNQQQARLDTVAKSRAPGRSEHTPEEWRLAQRADETSGSGGAQEEVERQRSSPGLQGFISEEGFSYERSGNRSG